MTTPPRVLQGLYEQNYCVSIGFKAASAVTIAPCRLSEKPMRKNSLHTLTGTWADRIILLSCLTLIAVAWLFIHALMASGPAQAAIYYNKTLLATYPLPQTGQASIHFEAMGKLGISEITIDQQGARITSSPCITQQCVLSGAHRHSGDMIACVPNQILVTIRGRSDTQFDAIAE
ncbi:MAG: NusG domain II-containing protein [Mariprofundus sp.]|nr:NusG domain II-containing protein [Mariprofundus sp.]